MFVLALFFVFVFVDDILVVDVKDNLPEDSPFLEAVKMMKEQKYPDVVDLCTKEIDRGLL